MKNIAIGIAVIAALIGTPALAADMAVKAPAPPAPVYSWTGFYVGLNGGYGRNDSTGADGCINLFGVVGGNGCWPTTGNVIRPDGGLFGAQAGYNWQAGSLVAGIETDIQWADIKGSGSAIVPCCVPFPNVPALYTSSAKMDWFGTTRGRIGLLAPPCLCHRRRNLRRGESLAVDCFPLGFLPGER
jgi:outer membrane immunogenic protein